jgi:gamma-glutamylcyclotransferase
MHSNPMQSNHTLEDDSRTTADAVASVRSHLEESISNTAFKVFSYGSNSTRQLCERLGRDPDSLMPEGKLPFDAIPAILPLYKRVFAGVSKRWGGAVASCHPHPSGQVLGLLATLTEKELSILDSYEIGYTRESISVVLADGSSFEAYIYLKQNLQFSCLPSESYMQAIARMFREAKHPIEELEINRVDECGSVQLVDLWCPVAGFKMIGEHSYTKH